MMYPTELRLHVNTDECPAAIEISPCGWWLAIGSISGEIRLFDLQNARETARWTAHKAGLHKLGWKPGSLLLASTGQDSYWRLWQIQQSGTVEPVLEQRIVDDDDCWVENIRWNSTGRLCALSAGKQLLVCTAEGTVITSYHFSSSTISDICWHPERDRLALAGYGGVEILDVDNPDSVPIKLERAGSILSIAWSPDAAILAAGCQDNAVHFWRLKDKSNAVMSGFNFKPVQLAWSKNSHRLVTGGSQNLLLWPFDKRGPEGRSVIQIAWHEQAVSALSVASGRNWLASGSRGGSVAIWKNTGDTRPLSAVYLTSRIEQIHWSPDTGKPRIAVASRDGLVGVWDVMGLRNR
jgi:WD40 repeat protein